MLYYDLKTGKMFASQLVESRLMRLCFTDNYTIVIDSKFYNGSYNSRSYQLLEVQDTSHALERLKQIIHNPLEDFYRIWPEDPLYPYGMAKFCIERQGVLHVENRGKLYKKQYKIIRSSWVFLQRTLDSAKPDIDMYNVMESTSLDKNEYLDIFIKKKMFCL